MDQKTDGLAGVLQCRPRIAPGPKRVAGAIDRIQHGNTQVTGKPPTPPLAVQAFPKHSRQTL